MQADLPSSSSRKAALLVMTSLLGLGGCSGDQHLLESAQNMIPNLRLKSFSPQNEIRVIRSADAAAPAAILKPRIEPAADLISGSTPVADDQPSWCKYLREDAAAQGTILRSPSVTGSYDTSGRTAVNMSLSYAGFRKADLLDEAAQVKCRQYIAQSSLQKIIFVTPQNLTAAGFRAKSNAIFSQRNEIENLRKEISSAMLRGDVARDKATSIAVLLDELIAEADSSKSQADRRHNEHNMSPQKADILSQELLRAEADLDDVNSRIRTSENMDVSVQAGWGETAPAIVSGSSVAGFSGKVTFAMKLGAVLPQRYDHERMATQAKLQSMRGEDGGLIWQIGVLRRAHQNAIAGLQESQARFDKALIQTRHLLAVLNSVQNPEFEGARLNARYQIMKIKAEKAGVAGSLAQIRADLVKLKNG